MIMLLEYAMVFMRRVDLIIGVAFDETIRVKRTCASFMVALCNRADHIYFHPVSFFFFFLLFFLRLISAVGDWMSTILRHMVWS